MEEKRPLSRKLPPPLLLESAIDSIKTREKMSQIESQNHKSQNETTKISHVTQESNNLTKVM